MPYYQAYQIVPQGVILRHRSGPESWGHAFVVEQKVVG
jgi:hypothetical protein